MKPIADQSRWNHHNVVWCSHSLNVNNAMLQPHLEGLTLEEAMQKKKLFMVDIGILEGITPALGTHVRSSTGICFV